MVFFFSHHDILISETWWRRNLFDVMLICGMLCCFPPDPADEMAVRQRIFNSTSPFSGSTQVKLKGSYPSCSADQEAEEEEEEGQDSKMGYIARLNPLINKLLTHGTAEQVGEMPLKTSTFIAQAECNYFPFLFKSNSPLCVNCDINIWFSQVNHRTLKRFVRPILNLLSPPLTASPAGMTLPPPSASSFKDLEENSVSF